MMSRVVAGRVEKSQESSNVKGAHEPVHARNVSCSSHWSKRSVCPSSFVNHPFFALIWHKVNNPLAVRPRA